jgi:hypothetical protein
MSKRLTFQNAVNYLNQGFNYQATGQSGVVTLKNASEIECLILQAEDGGERVSLFAPFLEKPAKKHAQKIIDLHLLHLNADLDTLGSLRISFNHDTNQYSLCDGAVSADNQEEFVIYVQEVLKMAKYLQAEIAEAIAQANKEEESDSNDDAISDQFLKA